MITQAESQKVYTADEYLDFEINSDTRHEYRNGEIVPKTGGTPNHNDIAGNLYILLKSALKGQNYRIIYVDQRLQVPEANLYTYPDVMVVPKPLEFQSGRKDTLVNPCLIAEVLSKSTQNYDRGEKFVAYRTIPSLQEYVLIDQYKPHVEQYSKADDYKWIFTEYNDLDAQISCASIKVIFRLTNIYENIDFEV